MNRLFVYRPNEKGFDDWIGDMPFARKIITDYEAEWDSVVKFRNHKEYVNAYNYYKRYRDFKNSLDDGLRIQLIFKLKNGFWRHDFTSAIKTKLIEKWMEFECPNKQSRLKRVTNEEIGREIREARRMQGIGRREMAELLGISENTYKCYEDGSRSIPYKLFYMLEQIITPLI